MFTQFKEWLTTLFDMPPDAEEAKLRAQVAFCQSWTCSDVCSRVIAVHIQEATSFIKLTDTAWHND
jgi:hypothetical protein